MGGASVPGMVAYRGSTLTSHRPKRIKQTNKQNSLRVTSQGLLYTHRPRYFNTNIHRWNRRHDRKCKHLKLLWATVSETLRGAACETFFFIWCKLLRSVYFCSSSLMAFQGSSETQTCCVEVWVYHSASRIFYRWNEMQRRGAHTRRVPTVF